MSEQPNEQTREQELNRISVLMRENPNGRKGTKPTRALGSQRDFRGSTPQSERHPSKITKRWIHPRTPLTDEQVCAKVQAERIAPRFIPELYVREGGSR